MAAKIFYRVGGCTLRLENHRIVTGQETEAFVRMDCLVAMHLPGSRVLCSYIGEEPIFYFDGKAE